MGKIISNGIEYNGIINNFNMDYRAGVQAITSDNGASYNITFDEPLNTVDYNVYLQSVNYSGQGFATMGYAVSNRTINGFTFTVYNTSSFSAHDIGWTAIPQNSNGISTNDKINYSTTEQKTGQKWIDGKDIYQKTYVFTDFTGLSSDRRKTFSLNMTVDNIVDINGMFYTGSAWLKTYSADLTSHHPLVVQITNVFPTNIEIYFGTSITEYVSYVSVTLYYTKSTT